MEKRNDARRQVRIEKARVILAEGADATYFFMHACPLVGASDIQVFDFGGINQLRDYLEVFKATPGYEQVTTLVIARDAESDAKGALRSVGNTLEKEGLPKPSSVFAFADGTPRTGIILFPGYVVQGKTRRLAKGSIEDCCLATVHGDPILSCVDEYLDCVRRKAGESPHSRKARLHAYLAGKKECAGLKLGEATKAKAWKLEHPSFAPFKQFLLDM